MSTLDSLITLRPQRGLGEITAQAVIQERHTDDLTITEHPIEQGAQITDHAFKRPAEVVLHYGWSESQIASLLGAANVLSPPTLFGDLDTLYQKLLVLQASRVPFEVFTGKRSYTNMLLSSIAVTTDEKTERALLVTATCKEVIIVQTEATTLPAKEKQKQQKKTGQVTPKGTNQLKSATPSPGGAAPIS